LEILNNICIVPITEHNDYDWLQLSEKMVSEDMVLPLNEVTDLKRHAIYTLPYLKFCGLHILMKIFSLCLCM
jgi:hypothetical protein